MDAKEYLIRQMKSCRKKMNLARLADYSVLFTAFGGIGGILCELASLFLPFYYAHEIGRASCRERVFYSV